MQTAVVSQEPQLKAKRTRKPKQDTQDLVQKQFTEDQNLKPVKEKKKPKTKRTIDPNKMTYIRAFQIWKQKQDPPYVGLSPKKGSEQYDQIMQILKGGVQ